MRILVTGSSGQIGTNLAQRLQREGHDVFGVDKRLNTWTDDFRYLLQDLSGHYPSFPDGIGGVEYPEVDLVVHLAAHAKVHQLVRQPHRALENAVMTFNVLEFCRQQNLPIVFSSSREVYGDVHRFAEEEASEASADFAYTESTYSASKIAGEAFVYSYARCYGLRYLVFRFSNVYGRYDNDLARMVRVLPLFIHTMLRDEPVTVFGQEKTLDFTYVDDCIDGITRGIEALAEGRVVNETINLAYGHGNSLVQAAELIAGELGVEPKIALAPSLLGEVTHYVADLTKARELLGYEPSVPLDEGIPARWRGSRSTAPRTPRKTGRSLPTLSSRRTPTLAGNPTTHRQVRGRCPKHRLAIFGPTASGKTASPKQSRISLGGEVLSADSMQAYRGLPILTAQPERPTRLVGIWPLTHEGSVAEYAELAHAAIDELLGGGPAPPWSPAVPVSISARRWRSSAASCPKPGATGAVGGALRPARTGAGVRRPCSARPRRGNQAASQRQTAGRQGARAHRARLFLAAGRRPALELRHPPPDAGLRARRSPRRPERTDRAKGSIHVRRRRGRGGAGRARRTDLVHRNPGARSARCGRASARGGSRSAYRANASLRRLPAEVDATHPGPC